MARRNRNSPGLVPQVPKSGYGFLNAVLDCLSEHSRDLTDRLDVPHQAGGNPGYPARQMLRLIALKYMLGERFANFFLNRVDNDPRLLELCGMSCAPSEVAFSRFENHKLVPHEKDLDLVVSAVVEDIAGKIEELRNVGVVPADAPSLGEILAIDATDIPAYANPNRDVPADPNAVWGYRTPKNKSPKSQTGQKEYFYGYDADVIVDAYHRMPLYLNTRPANWNEGPRMRDDVNALQSLHPWMKPHCLTADKGYHALYNFRYLTDRSILPIIAIPRPQKNPKTGRRLHEGLYNENGLPICIGGKVMDYVGTEEDGAHRFRCPEAGCHLKNKMDWSRYCDFDFSEKPDGKRLRIMGIVHRASPEWKRLFNLRPTVERWFSSAKRSRLLDLHQYLGQERVSLHAKMSMLGYLLTAWGRLMSGDYEGMRQMHIRLPRALPTTALGDNQERGECRPCPQHDSLAA